MLQCYPTKHLITSTTTLTRQNARQTTSHIHLWPEE